jgi:hypothetical protein
MFKDCKTGGYNLEASQANPERLVRLIFKLIGNKKLLYQRGLRAIKLIEPI